MRWLRSMRDWLRPPPICLYKWRGSGLAVRHELPIPGSRDLMWMDHYCLQPGGHNGEHVCGCGAVKPDLLPAIHP